MKNNGDIVAFVKQKDYVMVNNDLGSGSFGQTVLINIPNATARRSLIHFCKKSRLCINLTTKTWLESLAIIPLSHYIQGIS